MGSNYSVYKRGRYYYLVHRITPDGTQVHVSLRTIEQREAYRLAKQKVREAEMRVAMAVRTAEGDAEFQEWLARVQSPDADTSKGAVGELVENAARGVNKIRRERDASLAQQRRAEAARKAKAEQQEREIQLNLTNPRLDAFWSLGPTRQGDAGLFIDWCSDGNRSANTLIAYRTVWVRFREYFPHLERLGDVTPDVIKQFENKCKKDTKRGKKALSPAGIQQYLICLQGMFATAIKERWFEGENPVKMEWRTKSDKVAKYLTQEQAERLLDEAAKLDLATYLFIAIAVHTGMRKDEVANLRWEDIDFDRKLITLQAKSATPAKGIQEFQLKSRKRRTIPLKESLAEILEPHRKPEGYIIQSRSGREMKRTRWNLPAYFGQAKANAGVECSPHTFRHTFASWAAMEGVSIYKISEWLGHSTVQLTQDTYAHLQSYDADIDRF